MVWIFQVYLPKNINVIVSSILFISISLLFGCDLKQQKQSEALKNEIDQREVKKVSEAELLEIGRELGDSIANAAQSALASNLVAAVKRGGLSEAVDFCHINASPIVDSLINKYNATIKRTSFKIRNPADKPSELEAEILDAYHYNLENGLEMTSNVQETENAQILFTKPIMIGKELCLNCHGIVGEQVPEDIDQMIKSRYPKDEATGYQMGDLRGMWSISIPNNEIFKQL